VEAKRGAGAAAPVVLINKTGEVRQAGGTGNTRLAPERADAARVLALVRGQWQIEQQAHGGREVPCDADRSQGRWRHSPQVMAAGRLHEHGGGLPPLCSAARVSAGTHWHCTGKLKSPGLFGRVLIADSST
jgi:hypothetical protein